MEPVPPAVEARSVNHWAAREVPTSILITLFMLNKALSEIQPHLLSRVASVLHLSISRSLLLPFLHQDCASSLLSKFSLSFEASKRHLLWDSWSVGRTVDACSCVSLFTLAQLEPVFLCRNLVSLCHFLETSHVFCFWPHYWPDDPGEITCSSGAFIKWPAGAAVLPHSEGSVDVIPWEWRP